MGDERERYIKIGAKIKFYRQLKKIGQTELAGKVGITSQYLSKIECGKQMPSLQVLLLIAEKLEIDAAALISDSVVSVLKKMILHIINFKCRKYSTIYQNIERHAGYFYGIILIDNCKKVKYYVCNGI